MVIFSSNIDFRPFHGLGHAGCVFHPLGPGTELWVTGAKIAGFSLLSKSAPLKLLVPRKAWECEFPHLGHFWRIQSATIRKKKFGGKVRIHRVSRHRVRTQCVRQFKLLHLWPRFARKLRQLARRYRGAFRTENGPWSQNGKKKIPKFLHLFQTPLLWTPRGWKAPVSAPRCPGPRLPKPKAPKPPLRP